MVRGKVNSLYSISSILLPPKKNWKLLNLAAKPLRICGDFLAAAGGKMCSD